MPETAKGELIFIRNPFGLLVSARLYFSSPQIPLLNRPGVAGAAAGERTV